MAVLNCLKYQVAEFYSEGIKKLVPQYQKYFKKIVTTQKNKLICISFVPVMSFVSDFFFFSMSYRPLLFKHASYVLLVGNHDDMVISNDYNDYDRVINYL